MSAEDIIRKHRQRLEEHRRFLDKGAASPRESAGGVGGSASAARIDPRRSKPDDSIGRFSARSLGTHGEDPEGLGEDGKYVTTDLTRVYERNSQWLQHKQHAIEQQRHDKEGDATMGCTFRPNTNRSTPNRRRSEPPQPFYVTADSASTNHVLRQREARHLQQERRSRLEPDISRWEPRLTQPHEFNLGDRSQQEISSLRKPVAYTSGAMDKLQTTTPGTKRSRSAQPRPEPASKAKAKAVPAAAVAQGPSLEAVREMERKISHQELEIARLNGLVSSLRRELDVAKAKVRQLALAQQTVNQFL